jgi:hypothetical protein
VLLLALWPEIAAGQQTYVVSISGAANTIVPGFVPHGDPLVTGFAELTIFPNNTMNYRIVLEDDRYEVTQAHLYNINKTSATSGNPAYGDSIICWGGRWMMGGNSSDYLTGNGYFNNRLDEVTADPASWFLIIHTEGGHFANDANGNLVPFVNDRNGPQETSVTGVPEAERAKRFNNRIGKSLLDTVLRVDNPRDSAAPYHNPLAPDNQNVTPFSDANNKTWVEPDGTGGWRLTESAIERGYDLNTKYLFYLYDDQGPEWDFGGPEGAAGGFLSGPITFNGDLNFDSEVDKDDWLHLLSVYGKTSLTGLTAVQAYGAGDVNRDGIHSLADIQAFRTAFISAGGDLAGLIVVPEAGSGILVSLAVLLGSLLTCERCARKK